MTKVSTTIAKGLEKKRLKVYLIELNKNIKNSTTEVTKMGKYIGLANLPNKILKCLPSGTEKKVKILQGCSSV